MSLSDGNSIFQSIISRCMCVCLRVGCVPPASASRCAACLRPACVPERRQAPLSSARTFAAPPLACLSHMWCFRLEVSVTRSSSLESPSLRVCWLLLWVLRVLLLLLLWGPHRHTRGGYKPSDGVLRFCFSVLLSGMRLAKCAETNTWSSHSRRPPTLTPPTTLLRLPSYAQKFTKNKAIFFQHHLQNKRRLSSSRTCFVPLLRTGDGDA